MGENQKNDYGNEGIEMIISGLLVATTVISSTALVVVALKLKAARTDIVKVLNKNIIFLDEASNWNEKANEYQDKWLEASESLAENNAKFFDLVAKTEKLASENKKLRKGLKEISSKNYFEMGRHPAPYITPMPPWIMAEKALAK